VFERIAADVLAARSTLATSASRRTSAPDRGAR